MYLLVKHTLLTEHLFLKNSKHGTKEIYIYIIYVCVHVCVCACVHVCMTIPHQTKSTVGTESMVLLHQSKY